MLPLADETGIDHLKYSRRLRRLTTDLAAETSFESAAARMMEHHRVSVPVSAVRRITLSTARLSSKVLKTKVDGITSSSPQQLVMEMDGVMIPVVDYTESSDRRKTKSVRWMEMRVGAIQDHEKVGAMYASFLGNPEGLGEQMSRVLKNMCGESIPRIHGVGDGAIWIAELGESVGGTQYSHLIDFFHFCEYLHGAFEGNPRKELMVNRCKAEARAGSIAKVIRRLRREQRRSPNHQGVHACLRYIRNRPGQFSYDRALAKELPIGSGMIESTNRSLIQKRLKVPGSWWLPKTASMMADLRTVRANQRWEELWAFAA